VITEITSVIAVVLSVLYLGLQIRDNTKVLRSQAHYNALSPAQRPMEMMIENDGLATIVNSGYANPDALNADDWTEFQASFDEPFRSYVAKEFAKAATPGDRPVASTG
jgi:hypothetical protein